MEYKEIEKFNNSMLMIGSGTEIITNDYSGSHILQLDGYCGEILRVPDGVDRICCKGNPIVQNNLGRSFVPTSFYKIHIPDSVTELQSCAFYGNENLTKVYGGDRVAEVGNMAFEGCSSLKSLGLKRAMNIGCSCFEGCTSLVQLELPMAKLFNTRALIGCFNLKILESKPEDFCVDNLSDIYELRCLDLRHTVKWNKDKAENVMYLHNIVKLANCSQVVMPSISYIDFSYGRINKRANRRTTFVFESIESIGISSSCDNMYIKLLNTCDINVLQPLGGPTYGVTLKANVEYSLKSLIYGA